MERIIGPLLTRPDFSSGQWDGKRLAAANSLDSLAARMRLLEQAMQKPQTQTPPLRALAEEIVRQSEPEPGLRLGDLSVGDVFSFGLWRIRATERKKALKWQILEKGQEDVLVITKFLLCQKPFHSQNEGAAWETCSLRRWLNDEFYEQAFSSGEQANILPTNVPAESSEQKDTTDWVFLLSLEEARQCLPSDLSRACTTFDGKSSYWWLRTTWKKRAKRWEVCYVSKGGPLGAAYRTEADAPAIYVRPAMWLRAGTELDEDSVERKQVEV